MSELTGREVFKYGADDTICTAALGNFYKLHMQLEHHWDVYLKVELDACYLHAKSFFDGAAFSVAKMKELERIDAATYEGAWGIVRGFLIENGWEGTAPPSYSPAITPAEIKQAYRIVMDIVDEDSDEDDDEEEEVVSDLFLNTRVRTPSKLVTLLETQGHDEFAAMLDGCLQGRSEDFTSYVLRHFKGEPKFALSNKNLTQLLYEVMGLPIRVRNKATVKMLAAGRKEGNPKADALALAYAIRDAAPEQVEILQSLRLMQMVKTRKGLYYDTYPYLMHWKDGKIHSSHNQCATNTRRASSSGPNLQQLPKHPKIEGQPSKFRETFTPHKPGAVVVSMDFKAQELRVIAEYSQDANMLACFVGDSLKDMHALTAAGIFAKEQAATLLSLSELLAVRPEDTTLAQYEAFVSLAKGKAEQVKLYEKYRALGKKVNFTTEYGAAAPKLAATMLIEEDVAQAYIDAREAAFPRAAAWKLEVVREAKANGYVRTMLGAVRHLAGLLGSDDKYTASKAERQAVNFKIQSSSAEMTKLAEGRLWRDNIFKSFDAVYISPIHDEIVWSVMIEDLPALLPIMHKSMIGSYADMRVPIISSISFGKDFYNQIEIGDEPTAEAIAEGLAKMTAKKENANV